MDKPYQIILDIWEGNPDLDAQVVQANGAVGLIVRLNSIVGGHHMDEQFTANWEKSKTFPIQAIYFVYNPWVSGQANYDWLIAHMPNDYGKRRLFVDVEVRYYGYSPELYGSEVNRFCALTRAKWPCTIYSGAGYLDILTPWPKEEYWWAAYPAVLNGTATWEDYRAKLDSLDIAEWCKYCPGTPRMWQCSGDDVKALPGFAGKATDMNTIEGTLEEVAEWFGCELQEEESMAMPIGLFTRKAGWTAINPNFNFVAGAAQTKDTVDPNPNIKPIELEAIAGKIPMLLWWEHLPWAYSEEQWGENNWPDEAHDYIWQNFKAILGARTYQAVVISVNTYKARNGKDEDKAYIAFSAKQFLDRVGAWLKANRPAVPLILACSNDFIKNHAPNIANYAHNFYNCANQPTTLSGSYPADGAKPAYLGASTECEWWRYYEMAETALLVFRGANGYPATDAGMREWLNLTTPDPDGDDDDDDNTGAVTRAEFDALTARVAELERWRKS